VIDIDIVHDVEIKIITKGVDDNEYSEHDNNSESEG
jgi:hypothetical protein